MDVTGSKSLPPESHTMVLAGGQLFTFGLNDAGQLGLGHLANINRPPGLRARMAAFGLS